MLETILRKKDFYGGLLVALLGAGVVLNSTTYDIGTLMHMGPGMFPLILGILLTVVGGLILVAGLAAPLDAEDHVLPPTMEWRGWGCILGGPVMFIIFGEFLGMIAGAFMCVFVAALGDRTATVRGSATLALCVAIAGSFLFSYVLKVPFPLFRWGH